MSHPLAVPLAFTPVYHRIVWGGRAMAAWRPDLPPGPIGESWDLADHPRGMSVVAGGPLAGRSLRQLTADHGRDLIGETWDGGDFPLLVKLIDANDRLSIQVHPDDALAQSLGVGQRGKTECWLLVNDGGELFVGTQPGIDRAAFEQARAAGRVAETLERFIAQDGDFFFLAARTVHALGKGCLLYEVQQTCDVTFRVDDWGRVGLDGKPRPLHVEQSLATIDFSARSLQPVPASEVPHPAGGSVRHLVACDYFSVEERRAAHTSGGGNGRCTLVTCLDGQGTLATAAGALHIEPMRTYLVPAAAGAWTATAASGAMSSLKSQLGLRLLAAQPG
jgi:mannose-6-phosphate isomerase